MATVWITYAWADNEHTDVEFVAQELQRAGLSVKLDRWNLGAGRRLWEQIEGFICKTDQSDAWLLVATNNSLASAPCKEEFAYALDRALKSRGAEFPVIALFLTHADPNLIPAAIRTRLHVSITDPDWKERIVAAAEGRAHAAVRPEVHPYHLMVHQLQGAAKPFVTEVRPRAGVWAPFIAGIPLAEKDAVQPFLVHGPRDVPTDTGMMVGGSEGPSPDNSMWLMVSGKSKYTYGELLPLVHEAAHSAGVWREWASLASVHCQIRGIKVQPNKPMVPTAHPLARVGSRGARAAAAQHRR